MKKTNKKLDLENAEQANGKVESENITRLDQLLGDNGLWKYNTLDKAQYENSLKEMNTAELRSHASKMGIMPVANRDRLLKRLNMEFAKHVSIYKAQAPITSKKQGMIKVAGSKREVSEAAIKIMSECK